MEMKRIFPLILAFLLALAFGIDMAHGQYNNESLEGPWIVRMREVRPEVPDAFIIFDGQGGIVDFGIFNVPDSAGWYSVEANGEIHGEVWSDGYAPLAGQMTSDTSAVWYNQDTLSIPLLKVMDEGLLANSWNGEFIQDTTGTTYPVIIWIDGSGAIDSVYGFMPPSTGWSSAGWFFYEPHFLVGHFNTGESDAWDEIMIVEGSLQDNTISGRFDLDNYPGGTFTLHRDPNISPDEANTQLPDNFSVSQNFPNPFNPRTTIYYQLPRSAMVNIAIYNLTGQLVETLVSEHQLAGHHSVSWDASGLGSGVYFYKITAGGHSAFRKCLVLK
jgi:hypothetical protein